MITKVNNAIDLVKKGLDAQVALATAEQKESLANAKIALADLKMEIADLKEQNFVLKSRLTQKDEYVLDRSVYWTKDDGQQNQPYCPACYAKGVIIPLQKSWEGRQKEQSLWHCPSKVCSATYNPFDYREPESYVSDVPSMFSMDDRY